MMKLNGWKKATIAFLFFAAAAIASPAQVTFTSLASFDVTNGDEPNGPLAQGTDGKLYGTSWYGGSFNYCDQGCGLIFSLTTGGTLSLDYVFCGPANPPCSMGNYPGFGLLLTENGKFYGTTGSGGTEQSGTIFTLSGTQVKTLYNFCTLQGSAGCLDGFDPNGGLIQGTDGNFYGTTNRGGAATSPAGTLFKITPAGDLTTLYSFCADGGCPGGADPYAAPIQAANGNFYGTTFSGGANSGTNCPKTGTSTGCGAIYEATPAGKVTTLYNFCSEANCTDGNSPQAGLVQGNDGNFYGTTQWGGNGGTSNKCYGDCGTVFKITPAGVLTTLYNFCSQPNCTDGNTPGAGLVLGSDGNLYGTTYLGGYGGPTCATLSGCGTIFEITTSGTLTTLHSFDLTNGDYPTALFQATDGSFYGTTEGGGTSPACLFGCGAAFKLSTGLSPFVQTVPAAGKTGANVIILGTDLTGSTAVSFNGKAATFTVVSATEIKATVPAGAATGSVTVTTPTGILNSNKEFRIVN